MNWFSQLFARRAAANEHEYGRFQREFEVKRILGRGGFGTVFEAVKRSDNVTYAVKRIPFTTDYVLSTTKETDGQVYMSRESKTLKKLKHPGIVLRHDDWIESPPEGWQSEADEEMLGRVDPQWYNHIRGYLDDWNFIYVQIELCQYSLESWLERNNEQQNRPQPQMKSWFKQIVSAMAYLHGEGIFHRDLKPANILFADADTIKVCDFGLATEIFVGQDGEELAKSHTNAGTPLYMSPEQAEFLGKQYERPVYIGSKADVFALGIIFAEMCIVMTLEDLRTFCDNCRAGDQNIIIEDRSLAKFIEKLTQMDEKKRPTCAEILEDDFLA